MNSEQLKQLSELYTEASEGSWEADEIFTDLLGHYAGDLIQAALQNEELRKSRFKWASEAYNCFLSEFAACIGCGAREGPKIGQVDHCKDCEILEILDDKRTT